MVWQSKLEILWSDLSGAGRPQGSYRAAVQSRIHRSHVGGLVSGHTGRWPMSVGCSSLSPFVIYTTDVNV